MSLGTWPVFAAAVGFSLGSAAAVAQDPAGYARANPSARSGAGSYERISGRNNPALRYFGGASPAVYSQPLPPRPTPAPQPATASPASKPFSSVQQAAAISPYLGLDAVRETETSLPNYFLYVRPQLEQEQINQVQQAQYRKLQQQVRTAGAPGVAAGPGGVAAPGFGPQFMNSGGYYPALRR